MMDAGQVNYAVQFMCIKRAQVVRVTANVC